jgi:hypothetical protein
MLSGENTRFSLRFAATFQNAAAKDCSPATVSATGAVAAGVARFTPGVASAGTGIAFTTVGPFEPPHAVNVPANATPSATARAVRVHPIVRSSRAPGATPGPSYKDVPAHPFVHRRAPCPGTEAAGARE